MVQLLDCDTAAAPRPADGATALDERSAPSHPGAPSLLRLVAVRALRDPLRRRGARYLRFAAVAAGLLVLVPLVVGRLDLVPRFDAPFQERTVDRSTTPLLLAMADLSEYHAASAPFQVVVDLEQDRENIPSFLAGERVTFLGTGTVDAVVDFRGLGAGSVTAQPAAAGAAGGGSVTITLPAATLEPAQIDPSQSRVIDRDRGLANRLSDAFKENPVSEAQLYPLAAAKIDRAARSSELVARAETNTRTMLTALGKSLGYDAVTVTFTR